MTPYDIEILKQCTGILCRVRDRLIEQAMHCKNEVARSCINEVAAEINNQAHNLRKQYQFPRQENKR